MDAFWVIPLVVIVVPLLWVFYTFLNRRPLKPSEPKVLVDKPPDKPNVDPSSAARDWQGRPVASYLDELRERGGEDALSSPQKAAAAKNSSGS